MTVLARRNQPFAERAARPARSAVSPTQAAGKTARSTGWGLWIRLLHPAARLSFGAVLPLLAALSTGCGYHVAGKADLLPRSIHTIAIPAFSNRTTRYRLTERLPAAIANEFISRTRYRIVADPNTADAILQGNVNQYNSVPNVFDPATGRASTVQLSLFVDVTLKERATGTVLFSRERMEFRERYEISVDQRSYFDESDAALDRVTRDVARTMVSAILEKF